MPDKDFLQGWLEKPVVLISMALLGYALVFFSLTIRFWSIAILGAILIVSFFVIIWLRDTRDTKLQLQRDLERAKAWEEYLDSLRKKN